MDIELIMLIVIAILEVVDGQGIALRILRMLSQLIGGQTNVETSTQNNGIQVQSKTKKGTNHSP